MVVDLDALLARCASQRAEVGECLVYLRPLPDRLMVMSVLLEQVGVALRDLSVRVSSLESEV